MCEGWCTYISESTRDAIQINIDMLLMIHYLIQTPLH